ncbi:MAG: hypothetical protein EOO97_00120 [Pedobacter sp.]|nr:MAG: hypothetical protein EOO97_00120 [Pedobacter sp.]
MIDVKELLQKLPGSWSELTLRQYQKLAYMEVSDGPLDELASMVDAAENIVKVASTLTGIDLEELEAGLPMKELSLVGQKLAFLSQDPKPMKKSPITWKTVENASLSDFILFNALKADPFSVIKDLHKVIKAFAVEQMTEDQVLDLPMDVVKTGFFLLRMQLINYTKSSIRSNKVKLKQQQRQEKG